MLVRSLTFDSAERALGGKLTAEPRLPKRDLRQNRLAQADLRGSNLAPHFHPRDQAVRAEGTGSIRRDHAQSILPAPDFTSLVDGRQFAAFPENEVAPGNTIRLQVLGNLLLSQIRKVSWESHVLLVE